MPRHILLKLTKTKHNERILKAGREKQQKHTRETPYASQLIFQQKLCRPKGNGRILFKVLKGKNLQLRLLYLARISFKIDEEIKIYSDGQKLREFSTIKPVLQQMFKGTFIDNKYKRKRIYRINPKQLKKGQ